MIRIPKKLPALLALFLCAVGQAHAMRWYSPNTGRWVSRDPIEENGGLNLYGMVGNNPVSRIDSLGLQIVEILRPALIEEPLPFIRPGIGADGPPMPQPTSPMPIPLPGPTIGPQPEHSKRYWKIQEEESVDPNDWLFRSMRGNVSPEIGESARTLGVRPGSDSSAEVEVIRGQVTGPTNTAGMFQGMSVAPITPYNLVKIRRPKEFEGTGKDPVWAIRRSAIKDPNLNVIDDKPPSHSLISPHKCMLYEDYKRSLEATRPLWRKVFVITVQGIQMI
jgi:hypothetical protein